MKLHRYIFPLLLLIFVSACRKDPKQDPGCIICLPEVPDTNIYNPPLNLLQNQTWVINQYFVQNQTNPIPASDTLVFDDSTSYTFNNIASNYYIYKPQPLNKYTLRLNNTPWGDIQNSSLTNYNLDQGQIPGLEFKNIYNQLVVNLWINKIP